MTNQLRPTTIDGIRSLGRQISRDRTIRRNQGLNLAAQQAGYQNYAHAYGQLSQQERLGMRSIYPQNPRRVNESMNEFHQRALTKWGESLLVANPNLSLSLEWTSLVDIARILNTFVGGEMNHCHFPTGGGFDIEAAEPSIEESCVEFVLGHGTRHLFKPHRLVLEYIEEAPGESFLLLETDTIQPLEVESSFVDDPGHFHRTRQEIVRVGTEYYPRSHWDENHLGFDEDGYKIDMPDSAHILVRWQQGKFMLVSKGTLWNGSSKTYGGLHNDLSVQAIRDTILAALADLES